MNRDADHWLMRPGTVRLLIRGGVAVLALTLLAEAIVPIQGHHGVDEFPGFPALLGLLASATLVLLARALGFVLTRDEGHPYE